MNELYERVRRLLETYTLQEILEYNDYDEEDILIYLYEHNMIDFPTEPV